MLRGAFPFSVGSLFVGACALGPVDPAAELGLPEASTFSCGDLDGSEAACFDFSESEAALDVEGARWEVVEGRYVGWGPDTTPGNCGEAMMTHALIPGIDVEDVSISAELASLARVDKVIALRSTDEAHRLQINFRARDDSGNFGDLVVQEIRDCELIYLTEEGAIALPHGVGEKIDVEIELRGTQLLVVVGGDAVFDGELPLTIRSGRVGLGIIEQSVTMFDDVVVRIPDE